MAPTQGLTGLPLAKGKHLASSHSAPFFAALKAFLGKRYENTLSVVRTWAIYVTQPAVSVARLPYSQLHTPWATQFCPLRVRSCDSACSAEARPRTIVPRRQGVDAMAHRAWGTCEELHQLMGLLLGNSVVCWGSIARHCPRQVGGE